MKRKQYIWIGLLLFLLLVLIGPLLTFPKLQTKLDNEVTGLHSYNALPVKSLKWQGRNAYLLVPDGTDTALIVNAMNDMKAIKGVRGVDLSYGIDTSELLEVAEPMVEIISETVASTTATPESEPSPEVQTTMADETMTLSDDEAPGQAKTFMDELLTLSAIEFDFDTVALREGSKEGASQVAELLRSYPETRLKVIGHTDSTGTTKNNVVISLGRAQAFVDELIIQGIEADRLIAEGRGEAEPIASNESEEGRKLNRRVVLTEWEN